MLPPVGPVPDALTDPSTNPDAKPDVDAHQRGQRQWWRSDTHAVAGFDVDARTDRHAGADLDSGADLDPGADQRSDGDAGVVFRRIRGRSVERRQRSRPNRRRRRDAHPGIG
jgi:hypothetical protein